MISSFKDDFIISYQILLNKKRISLYEYMTSFKNFKELLPSKEKFYSLLKVKRMINKEYDHVLKVWNKFEMKTMKCYHDLHLKCDVGM